MLEPIKVKAIEAAVRTLTNLGCNLKVITPDGVEFGDLVVAPVKTKTVANHFVQTGYREAVDALGVGDITTVAWPDLESIENLRASMASRCIRSFGVGSCTTEIDRDCGFVTLLRVA